MSFNACIRYTRTHVSFKARRPLHMMLSCENLRGYKTGHITVRCSWKNAKVYFYKLVYLYKCNASLQVKCISIKAMHLHERTCTQNVHNSTSRHSQFFILFLELTSNRSFLLKVKLLC